MQDLEIYVSVQSSVLSATASMLSLARSLLSIKKFAAVVLEDGTIGVASSSLKTATHRRIPCFCFNHGSIFVDIY